MHRSFGFFTRVSLCPSLKMPTINCCSVLLGKKKKSKASHKSPRAADFNAAIKSLKVSIEQTVKTFDGEGLKTVPSNAHKDDIDVKVMSREGPVEEAAEVAYEGEDEHEENASMRRDLSDVCPQSRVADSGVEGSVPKSTNLYYSGSFDAKTNEKTSEKSLEMVQCGNVSDPGIEKAEFWGSPVLQRSCSNLETNKVPRKVADRVVLSKYLCSRDLQKTPEKLRDPGSPETVMTHLSADAVMLKKHSSSQVLPSRSRKLWWKLFLWSHRNLHKPQPVRPQPKAITAALNQQGGYCSDTIEPDQNVELSNMQSPGSFTEEPVNNLSNNNGDDRSWGGFHGGVYGFPQNQWVAFSTEPSPFARVDQWMRELDTEPPPPENDENRDETVEAIIFPSSPGTGRSPGRTTANQTRHINLTEEILHANSIIQSLNSSSTVAHISGIGLKAIPMISHFSSLRSVNLSDNYIVSIVPGSLPKGLHSLNLSKNNIHIIEGLRELTRLRILDLSYNRISRIGQGLSNCTIIKELYLAGNKISDVEGLHRLLKLTVLDLSFNKITTTKALGQVVANYNSLQALNLLGNPIQSNINEEQVRKAVCGLLPKLVFLNKQPIKPQRAHDILTDTVAKAALGSGSSSSRYSRRKPAKRISSSGSSSSVLRSSASTGAGQKSRHRSTSRTHHHLKTVTSGHAPPTR